jgi:hypothetical protein
MIFWRATMGNAEFNRVLSWAISASRTVAKNAKEKGCPFPFCADVYDSGGCSHFTVGMSNNSRSESRELGMALVRRATNARFAKVVVALEELNAKFDDGVGKVYCMTIAVRDGRTTRLFYKLENDELVLEDVDMIVRLADEDFFGPVQRCYVPLVRSFREPEWKYLEGKTEMRFVPGGSETEWQGRYRSLLQEVLPTPA